MTHATLTTTLGLGLGLMLAGSAASQSVFREDFSTVEPGPLPDAFLVLDGQFAIREDSGNRLVELPGAPLESYGFLFGPSEASGVEAGARIFATRSGRKFPTFGLGLNGASGYRLQVAAGKGVVELLRGEMVVASAPFAWKSGAWTRLKLSLRKTGDTTFRLEGTVWTADDTAPPMPTLTFDETKVQPGGKASAWGLPFSGTPIQFDDLTVTRLGS